MTKKVVLVQPNYKVKADAEIWTTNPPLGLLYLAAVLEKNKIPVKIIDANVENLSWRKAVSLIKKEKPDFVGFSIMTPAADWSAKVAKNLNSPIIKIAGGPHASALPKEILFSGYDLCIIGEGEETLLEIVQGKDRSIIKGIAYRKGRKVIINLPRTPLNPNKLPLPARHLIVKGGTDKPYLSAGTRYYPWAQILTSRGCPYNCYFCNKNIFGYQFRPRTPANVLREIDFLVKNYRVREIDFYDDSFNFDIKRAEKIMDLIIKRKYKLYLRFSNGIRADKVTGRLLRKMKKAGTDYIAYGIESGDERVLSMIPKAESLDQIRKAVKLTNKIGIPVTGFFILGLLGDTRESMQRTIDFAKSLPFDRIILNIAAPFPGTRMWRLIKEKKGKILIKKWQDFYNTSGKMVFTFPGMASPVEVEEMYRRAHRDFYFRPQYLLKNLPRLFSLSQLPIMYRGLKRIFFSLRTD
ncbi:MAG: Ribosomal protein S12 methylthiotransferase RimO [Microgenomates group bacterium ADurb.Bin219]|nr:MAG: Ribosomal protein S12 methylthiotransferase RimO [Microgenomates group bacterium ADurb.Bin219]HNP89176.1 radical SAM protein [Candidatus Woesebacteria bacterium]